MSKTKKAVLLAVCAIVLVVATVVGTLAYFTSKDAVKNTFSVGKVALTMDEGALSADGKTIDTEAARVKANQYKLIPGRSYEKDPVVHIEADCENAWVFVKVDNAIAALEPATVQGGYTAIADQIVANGWTKLEDGVYYRLYTTANTVTDYAVFTGFKVSEDVDATVLASGDYANKAVDVAAYAIQAEGFDDPANTAAVNAAAAWDVVSKLG